jgi:hypothetical protein
MHFAEDDNLRPNIDIVVDIDYQSTIADVHQGMIDYEQGRGEPLSEAVADIKRQLRSCL